MTVNAITKEKISELYDEAGSNLKRAKELLEQGGELTDEQNQKVNAWIENGEKIRKQAEAAEKLMAEDAALAEKQAAYNLAKEKEEDEQKAKKAGFEHAWEYAKAVHDLVLFNVPDPRVESLRNTKDMSGEVGVSGGFLLPTEQREEILQTRGENGFLRSRARVVPMGTRAIDFPAVDYSKGAAGKSAFFGGIEAKYVGEEEDTPETQPYFKTIELRTKEIAGCVDIPNSMMRDSPQSMEAFLSGPGAFGGALAWMEDYGALRDPGGKKMLGILNADANIDVSRVTATKFGFADAVAMASRMILSGSPMWLMSQSVMSQLYQMVDGASNNIWQPSAAVGKPDTLLGWPIKWTEKLPALGTAGDVVLVDWSWYLLGDREAITFDVSRENKFKQRQTVFMATEAIDGKPWLDTAITLADNTTTVSPFIILN